MSANKDLERRNHMHLVARLSPSLPGIALTSAASSAQTSAAQNSDSELTLYSTCNSMEMSSQISSTQPYFGSNHYYPHPYPHHHHHPCSYFYPTILPFHHPYYVLFFNHIFINHIFKHPLLLEHFYFVYFLTFSPTNCAVHGQYLTFFHPYRLLIIH
ncbi:uncharacterized protein F5147DRAFT_424149 [Suillus discolor]|uniref:Uncharacterized protein n=1 Tax=Suillus discolor TaxID=1912936 RepID=A0A9P7EWI3_9AGAM|nr:uncharacterized protein F5147DRAFT_424149 [Suillus discolor]KAG2093112.1 hypothetical protein F5147DRAFT_424149 [Suillus discolor]